MAAHVDTPVDSGWSWVILAASFGGLFLQSLIYMNGIFNVIFLEVFQKDMATTSWVGSICFGLWNTMGPVSSLLVFRFGSRITAIIGGLLVSAGYLLAAFAQSFEHVFISLGLIAGIGYGISYLPSTITVGYYFKRYRNLAFGITNTGIGLGVLVFSPIVQIWIQYYGWRGGMLLVAASSLHLVVFAALLRPVQMNSFTDGANDLEKEIVVAAPLKESIASELGQIEDTHDYEGKHFQEYEKATTNPTVEIQGDNRPLKTGLLKSFKTLLTRSYVLYCFTQMLCCAGMSICYLHFPEYAHMNGAGSTQLATLMSVIGATNIIGRFLVGLATSHPDFDVILVQIGSSGISAFSFFVLPLFVKSFAGQVAFGAIFGFYANCFLSLLGPINIRLAGLENLPVAMGVGLVMCGVGFTMGPPFAGWVFDLTGSFAVSFFLAGGFYFLSALMMMGSFIGKKTS